MEESITLIKAIHEYGLFAILGLLIGVILLSWRHLGKVLLDKDTGLVITGHRELIQSIQMNRESNRINAESNAMHAKANERHARSHERTSRVLVALANHLQVDDIIDASGSDDDEHGN